MVSLRTLKKRVKARDGNQCQTCGDIFLLYGRLEVHHIVPRCQGGPDELENLVTLCDLCHAVLHDHMGPAWVGLSKFPAEEQEQNNLTLEQVREEFDIFLRLPIKERHRTQKEIWPQWGVRKVSGLA